MLTLGIISLSPERISEIQQMVVTNISLLRQKKGLVVWLVRFYGISTFVGCLMPNPFLY